MRRVWPQSSFEKWPKVAVGVKAMIFLCIEVKVAWFSGCYSGLLHPIIVVQASFTRSFCVALTDYQSFSGSLKLMASQVEQDACSFMGAYGRNGRQWVNIPRV